MARQKSDEKRNAIVNAATQVIAAQGLGASTAKIAAAAGVSNGSLFTYFETKAVLLNQLYLAIKADMVADLMRDLPQDAPFEEYLRHAWGNWMDWALANPAKRHVLAQLMVSDEITAETRREGDALASDLIGLMERIRSHGALSQVPMGFALRLVNALVEASMDAIVQDPAQDTVLRAHGFAALWRAIC